MNRSVAVGFVPCPCYYGERDPYRSAATPTILQEWCVLLLWTYLERLVVRLFCKVSPHDLLNKLLWLMNRKAFPVWIP